MKNIFSKLKNEKGQAAVEFALVAIVLLLFVFGIVEFGRAWYRADLLKNAANTGARTCAVTKDISQATLAAQGAIPNYKSPPTNIIISTCTPTPVTQVTVTVTEPFNPVVPLLLPMLNSITLTRTATYRVEP